MTLDRNEIHWKEATETVKGKIVSCNVGKGNSDPIDT